MRKYSKPSAFYLESKKDFFLANKDLLEKQLSQNELYVSQPARNFCKLCDTALPVVSDFRSHGVDYVFCESCNHLNGKYQDTKEFVEKLYIADDGEGYAINYLDANFLKRTTDIYIPKVDFLVENLPAENLSILDVGCGSGYFVYAALLKNLKASGLDVNRRMIDFGNNQISHLMKESLGVPPLKFKEENDFYDAIKQSGVDVISAIGVIEHLREPHKFFSAFRESEARYLYYSVPMFSVSALLENIFPDVFPRQLSGGHTHLFTEKSIEKMNEVIGVHPIAEWRFGTDAMDLYRSVMVKLSMGNASQKVLDSLFAGFGEKIDDVQSVFDRNHFCSEIHCLVSKAS